MSARAYDGQSAVKDLDAVLVPGCDACVAQPCPVEADVRHLRAFPGIAHRADDQVACVFRFRPFPDGTHSAGQELRLATMAQASLPTKPLEAMRGVAVCLEPAIHPPHSLSRGADDRAVGPELDEQTIGVEGV
jgi:hypothetical protein